MKPAEKVSVFNEHCMCCDKPCVVTYEGEKFSSAKCGCPIRFRIRSEENDHFIRKIREAK
jgi:hypothetical protein